MAEGKYNLEMPRKRMPADLLGKYHIFLTNSENFFYHNSRRVSKAELSPSVLYEKKKNYVHKLGKAHCFIFIFLGNMTNTKTEQMLCL